VILLVGAAPGSLAESEVPEEGSEANILVTFRIGRLEDGKRIEVKAYELVVADGSRGSSLLSGARIPFPAAEGGMQAFVYQNIGFTTKD
jgi:hypothetical protein